MSERQRTGVRTRAVTVVRYGDQYTGTPRGARCAVKGCAGEATMFCRKNMGGTNSYKVVAVVGYCMEHDAVAARFQRERVWIP